MSISKTLSYLLRHCNELSFRPDGYVLLTEVMEHLQPRFTDVNLIIIQEIVANCNKQRFSMIQEDSQWFIRANQGHSIASIHTEALFTLITWDMMLTGSYDTLLHGTKKEAWSEISRTGLSKMNRRHLHLAKGLDATSGIRSSSTLHIYIDIQAAHQSGIRFYESSNGVILTEQDIPVIFFTKVMEKRNKVWSVIDV